MSDHESAAEREGIVDQQDAALEQMEQDDGTEHPRPDDSTAERAGIVDQQGAVLEAMEGDDDRAS